MPQHLLYFGTYVLLSEFLLALYPLLFRRVLFLLPVAVSFIHTLQRFASIAPSFRKRPVFLSLPPESVFWTVQPLSWTAELHPSHQPASPLNFDTVYLLQTSVFLIFHSPPWSCELCPTHLPLVSVWSQDGLNSPSTTAWALLRDYHVPFEGFWPEPSATPALAWIQPFTHASFRSTSL